jgi:hypothetical protein
MKLRITIAAAAGIAALAIPAAAGAAVPHFLTDPRTPTDITAVADPPGGLGLTGTLTTAAGPVAGATVTFTTSGSSRLLCTAVTNAGGLAACAITGAQRTLIRAADGIWYARFAGDATLAPVFRAGHL